MSDGDGVRFAADRGVEDGDRLPWLEPVEEERAPGAGAGKTLAALFVALIVIGLVVGGVFWLRADRGGADGSGEMIAAPAGDYKVRPDQPGGMKVEGEGETAFAASDGRETDAAIDLSAVPETPVAGAGSTPDAAPDAPTRAAAAPATTASATPPAPVRAAQATPAAPASAAPPAGTTQIQLGAFGSEAKANAAWKTLSGRYAFLAPLERSVMPVAAGDKTLYRLRATAGGQAAALCARLKVAGETCAVIG